MAFLVQDSEDYLSELLVLATQAMSVWCLSDRQCVLLLYSCVSAENPSS